jgi:hypothetical protein
MADTGYNWGDWAFVQKSGTGDWDGLAIADDGNAGSAAIALDGKAACIISVQIVEDNTGAVVANSVTIAILGDTDGTNYEDIPGLADAQVGRPMKFKVTPVQNDTVFLSFNVDPKYYDNFKVWILNESGQELVTDVRIKTATIPAAS